jgi:hypothetical protein
MTCARREREAGKTDVVSLLLDQVAVRLRQGTRGTTTETEIATEIGRENGRGSETETVFDTETIAVLLLTARAIMSQDMTAVATRMTAVPLRWLMIVTVTVLVLFMLMIHCRLD